MTRRGSLIVNLIDILEKYFDDKKFLNNLSTMLFFKLKI